MLYACREFSLMTLGAENSILMSCQVMCSLWRGCDIVAMRGGYFSEV